jgi:hypothetical protein
VAEQKVPEYVLMTDPVAQSLDEAMRLRSKPLMHDFEGLGETSTHYIDLAGSEVLPVVVPERSSVGRLWLKVKLGSSSLPFLVGIKKPAEGFRNLGRGTEDQLAG